MESGLTLEHRSLINELTQGMEKAKQLQFHLRSTPHSEEEELLVQRILSSFEQAQLILKWTGGSGVQNQAVAPSSGAPESSVSVDGSPRSEELKRNFGDHAQDYTVSKKSKHQPTWTEQVRVSIENGLEGPADDGFSWRKYGQKDILGARHPRSYYRCRHRLVQHCWATKQVQRSDDDPTIFDITYKGTHTCHHSAYPAPPSPGKQKLDDNKSHNHQPQEQHNQTLLDLKANLRVTTESLDTPPQFSFPSTYDTENYYYPNSSLIEDNQFGTYSSLFVSPATSGSNYFYAGAPSFQHSESDIAEIISAHASTTNSPIGGGMEFPVDPVELDPNFTYNVPGFFTRLNSRSGQ